MIKNHTVVELSGRDQYTDTLPELLRQGARKLIEISLFSKVITGVKFIDGVEATTLDQNTA